MQGRWLGALVVLAACGGSSGDDGGGDDGGGGPPPTQEEIVAACVIAGSCGIADDGVNNCYIELLPFLSLDDIRCLAGARGDCNAARDCVGFHFELAPGCTPGRVCDGNTVVECENGVRTTLECGSSLATGPTCLTGSDGLAWCGVATCSSLVRTCDGARAQECDGARGVLTSIECAERGLECVNGTCTSPGGGSACLNTTPPRCDGDVLVTCDDDFEARRDCAATLSGATCITVPGSFPDAYCGFASDCYPERRAESCSGTSLSFCAAGAPTTVDCTSLGFGACSFGACRR